MSDVHWIKLSTRTFSSSRKIKYFESLPNADTILVIWIKLLLLAGSVNDDGQIYLTPKIPYTKEMLANELRRPLDIVEKALSLFVEYGMIEIDKDYIHLTSWDKYQSTEELGKNREQNRRRQAKYRAKHKGNNGNVISNGSVTQGNTPDTDTDADADTETETEMPINLSSQPVQQAPSVSYKDTAKREYRDGKLGKGVVMLSDEQNDDLLDKLSLEEYDHYVSVVADRILRGHKYGKTHYQAILEMAAKDRANIAEP